MGGREEVEKIAKSIRDGVPVEAITVRKLLEWFGAQRRGYWIVDEIRATLDEAGVATIPDFESAHIDSLVEFAATSTRTAREESRGASKNSSYDEHAPNDEVFLQIRCTELVDSIVGQEVVVGKARLFSFRGCHLNVIAFVFSVACYDRPS